MPTPMHVYNEIAARYGVDPADDDAVCRWFEEEVAKLPEDEQAAIALELLERDGEESK